LWSSNAKDIGVLYLIFALFAGVIGTSLSVLIRVELSGTGVQYISNNQLYNSIITAHAIVMIFFMVMPGLIGGFGNFLTPISGGGPDMAYPRLNNISFWLLIPSIVLFIFAINIENGVGTGWTLNNDKELLWGDLEAIKLFSMRGTFLVLCNIHVVNYSYLIFIYLVYVKMFAARKQYAWVKNVKFSTHQRLNEKYLYNNDKEWFEQWLVGVTDGGGSFSIVSQNNKWSLAFKIAQPRYNLRLLFYIKKELKVGSVTKDGTKGLFFIRDRKMLNGIIFPIFDKYPLLTSKMFNYKKFKEAYVILDNNSLSKDEKDKKLFILKDEQVPINYISPPWITTNLPLTSVNDVKNIMSKPWLVGFIEAESSFYLVKKDSNIIVHGFGLTQKLDSVVLEAIGLLLHIATKVRFESKHNYYNLDTTNSRAIENIIEYFINTMKGMKSLEYRIWARSYVKHKGNLVKLTKPRDLIIKLRTKLA